jgi:hypothetical protein
MIAPTADSGFILLPDTSAHDVIVGTLYLACVHVDNEDTAQRTIVITAGNGTDIIVPTKIIAGNDFLLLEFPMMPLTGLKATASIANKLRIKAWGWSAWPLA